MNLKPGLLISTLFPVLLFGILSSCRIDDPGNALDDYSDRSSPTVTETSPSDGQTAVNVHLQRSIEVIFSEEMDDSSFWNESIHLSDGSTDISGLVSYSDKTASFDPSGDLLLNTHYTVTARSGVEDIADNVLQSDYVWSFNTLTVIPLPETGQEFSYTATYGEDGDYTINPLSYTNHGDGTVSDNLTGLMWQQEDDNTTPNWSSASTSCASLLLAGYTDWRLPAIWELLGLADYETAPPEAIDTIFTNADAAAYWTSTTADWNTSFRWIVGFGDGSAGAVLNTNPSFFRCVRKNQLAGPDLYDHLDGTILNKTNGLVWQQEEGGTMDWEAALSYCENLELAQRDDWRLPNVKELQSLIDHTANTPALDTVFFPGVNSAEYWTSTTSEAVTARAWIVNFSTGLVSESGGNNGDKVNSNYVRCVRAGQ